MARVVIMRLTRYLLRYRGRYDEGARGYLAALDQLSSSACPPLHAQPHRLSHARTHARIHTALANE